MSRSRPLRRSRAVALLVAAAAGASTGCSIPRTIRLTCDAPAPVLLGKPLAVGGGELAYENIDEEYQREVYFRGVPPGAVAEPGGDPLHQGSEEEGLTNVFQRNGVSGSIYLGRYEGLIIFVPVWNSYLGVEGDVVRVAAAGELTADGEGRTQ